MKLKKKIKIAIDSPAAAGAGTQAKLISKHFNLFYLDTGKIYRLIANIKLNQPNKYSHSIRNDHRPGCLNYVIRFGEANRHKIFIGWDLNTLPDLKKLSVLSSPSLALIEANTFDPQPNIKHTSVTELVESGFLEALDIKIKPQHYGIYLVHYSGIEDKGGMLTDQQILKKIQTTYPQYSDIINIAYKGQEWFFDL